VFTLPEPLRAGAYQNQPVVYGLLFRAAAETLRTLAADPKPLGVQLGFCAVLHSWGQTLGPHPHLHCVVTGGGLSLDGRCWRNCRQGFLLPVRVLSRLFPRLFLEYLRQAFDAGQLRFFSSLEELQERRAFLRYLAPTPTVRWVVYAKRPFAGPQQVRDYVGRYTHRVAISHHRLLAIADAQVCFRWKDYQDGNQQKTMTLPAEQFLRRFLLHVLPAGFQRLRYSGLLGNRHRQEKLARCRQLLGRAPAETAVALDRFYPRTPHWAGPSWRRRVLPALVPPAGGPRRGPLSPRLPLADQRVLLLSILPHRSCRDTIPIGWAQSERFSPTGFLAQRLRNRRSVPMLKLCAPQPLA
jgi:hypothetical protein